MKLRDYLIKECEITINNKVDEDIFYEWLSDCREYLEFNIEDSKFIDNILNRCILISSFIHEEIDDYRITVQVLNNKIFMIDKVEKTSCQLDDVYFKQFGIC